MENDSEWLYSELLEQMKQKEKEKEDSYYRPIELELPLIMPPPFLDEPKKDEDQEKRGVIIIEIY